MSNKKGGVAVEELRGILTFMIIAVILMLLFFGCSITKTKKEYEHLKFSKDDIQVTKELNRFLEIPVDPEKKIYDTIIRYLKDAYVDSDPEIFNKRMDDIGKVNLPAYRRMLVILPSGGILYDSLGRYAPRDIYYAGISEGIALFPVSIGPNRFDFVEIVLQ